jgi:hypothetical protein
MTPQEIELILNSVALSSLCLVLTPRLLFYMELRRLNDATKAYLGSTANLPKPVLSRMPMHEASRSVQKALAKRKSDFRWNIKVHDSRDNIEQAVRIEGFVPVEKLGEFNETAVRSQTARGFKAEQLDMKITVDIYKHEHGSQIVWKYHPTNAGEFQRRQQIFDPALNFLMSNTNFNLLKELAWK